jgi:hypothetical protein
MAEDAFYDMGIIDKPYDFHLMTAARTTERVNFPDFLNELSPGLRGNAAGLTVRHIQYRRLRRVRRRLILCPIEVGLVPFSSAPVGIPTVVLVRMHTCEE